MGERGSVRGRVRRGGGVGEFHYLDPYMKN